MKKKKGSESSSTLGIFVIEANLSTSTFWILDTDCGSHICTNVQKFKRSKTSTKGKVDL